MKTSYPLDTFPQFLKFYNCLEFISGEDYSDLYSNSNVQLYWGLDSKPRNIYLEVVILLVFKYDKYKMFIKLDGLRNGKLSLQSDINFDNCDLDNNYYDVEFSYRISRSIDIPEFKQLLLIKFDKSIRYKDLTDGILLKNRCIELYNRLVNEEILFNILKPHINDIKNFEFMFLKQSDFINNNYFNIVNTHDKVQSIINHQQNQQRNE